MVGAGSSLFVALNFLGTLSLDNVTIASAGDEDAALMAMSSSDKANFIVLCGLIPWCVRQWPDIMDHPFWW